jgi:hypothetical protein
MIQIKQAKEYDTDRCSACFDNAATVIVNLGNEDAQRPGKFAGGYKSFGLCRDCAKQLENKLGNNCVAQECVPPSGTKEDCALNENGLCVTKSCKNKGEQI